MLMYCFNWFENGFHGNQETPPGSATVPVLRIEMGWQSKIVISLCRDSVNRSWQVTRSPGHHTLYIKCLALIIFGTIVCQVFVDGFECIMFYPFWGYKNHDSTPSLL